MRLPFARAINDLNHVADHFNGIAERLEAQNRVMLDDMFEDENRLRSWDLVIRTGDAKYRIPAKCSRSQIRKAKIALHNVGLDAIAVES